MRRGFFILLVLVGLFIIGAFVYIGFFAPKNGEGERRTFLGLELPFGDPRPPIVDEGTVDEGPFPDDSAGGEDIPAGATKREKLFNISNQPIAGFALYTRPKDVLSTATQIIEVADPATGEIITEEIKKDIVKTIRSPRVRYVDSIFGNIYETEFTDWIQEKYIAKTGMVDIGQALFGGEDTVILRYYDLLNARVETQRGRLVSTLGTVTCPQTFDQRLTIGATGRTVEELQVFLQTLLNKTTQLQPGIFDTATQALVQDFQKSLGMKPDGIVGAKTNQELTKICIDQERERRLSQVATRDSLPYLFSKSFFADPIIDVVMSPDMTNMFTLIKAASSVSGVLSTREGTNTRQIYNMPFSDWIIEWPSAGVITLTTKASGLVPGYMYSIDVATGSFQKVMGGYNGLTTRMSPNGTRVLFQYTDSDNTIQVGIFDIQKQSIKTLPIKTLPEKCVWTKDSITLYCGIPEFFPLDAVYPDEWYQHLIQFDDALWKINTLTNESVLVNTLADFPDNADITSPQLTPEEDFFLFIDNDTKELWGYEL